MPGPIGPVSVTPPRRPWAARGPRASTLATRLWRTWRRRQELRRLREVDDRLLRDIGVSRGEVERELATPVLARRRARPTAARQEPAVVIGRGDRRRRSRDGCGWCGGPSPAGARVASRSGTRRASRAGRVTHRHRSDDR